MSLADAGLLSSRRPEIPWLPETGPEVDAVIELLKQVQEKFPQGRFHLLLETETVIAGSIRTADTRVLFSPTISFVATSPEKESKAQELAHALRSLSVMSMPRTSNYRVQVPQVPSRRRICAEKPVCPETNRDASGIPTWFPGSAYTNESLGDNETWKKMKEERLKIGEDFANKFSALETGELRDVYQVFFSRFHARVRNVDQSLVSNRVEYSRFTPPWIRQQLSVGNNPVCYLSTKHSTKPDAEKICLPDLRTQRNTVGNQRMALILAAFYEYEPELRTLLDSLLGQINDRRRGIPEARSKRRVSPRKGSRSPKRGPGVARTDNRPEQFVTNRATDPTVRENTSVPNRATAATVRENTSEPLNFQGHEIFCAFGMTCRLRGFPQNPEGITATCIRCQVAKMHDLCCGGEDGERICPRCKESEQ